MSRSSIQHINFFRGAGEEITRLHFPSQRGLQETHAAVEAPGYDDARDTKQLFLKLFNFIHLPCGW